jgi:hypothetical protein
LKVLDNRLAVDDADHRVNARDAGVRKHHRGLLGVATDRERGAIQLDPLPWLTSFYDHEVVADVVGGASRRE